VYWLVATALRYVSILSTNSVLEGSADFSSSETDSKYPTLSWLSSLQSSRAAISALLREEDFFFLRKSVKALASLLACFRLV